MSVVSQVVTIFLAVFIVVDPFGIVPVFISLTGGFTPARRRATILKSVIVAFVVLCLFIFTGNAILGFIGIQPGSFFIAGGILMFIISIDLLLGKPGRTKTSDTGEGGDREDVSIVPLAIPMLAGPGAITTVLLYVSEGKSLGFILPVLTGSVALALACAGLTMLLSSFFLRVLGKTGVSVIERIMGIVLTGLSVQFVYDGLVKLGIVAGAWAGP
jgi:multiple antibiotic resistance protein